MDQKLLDIFSKTLDVSTAEYVQTILENYFKELKEDPAKYNVQVGSLSLMASNTKSLPIYMMSLNPETKKEYMKILLEADIDYIMSFSLSKERHHLYKDFLTCAVLFGDIENMVEKIVDDFNKKFIIYKDGGSYTATQYVSPSTFETIINSYISGNLANTLFNSFTYDDASTLIKYVQDNYVTKKTIMTLLSLPFINIMNVPIKYSSTFLDLVEMGYFKTSENMYGKPVFPGSYSRSYVVDKLKDANLFLTKDCLEYIQSNSILFEVYDFVTAFQIKDYDAFQYMNDNVLTVFRHSGSQSSLSEFIKTEDDFRKIGNLHFYITPDVLKSSIEIIKQNPQLIKEYAGKIFPVQSYYNEIAFDNLNTIQSHIKLKDFLRII